MDDDIDFETFFRIPNRMYKTLGFDFQHVPSPPWQIYLKRLYTFVLIGSGLLCKFNMLQQIRELLQAGDIFNGIRVGTFLAYAFDSTIKILAFLINVKRLRKIYNTLAEEYPRTLAERKRYCVQRHNLSRITRCIAGAYVVTCILVMISALCQSIGLYVYDLWQFGYKRAQFAYLRVIPMSYGFEVNTPLNYAVVYTSEVTNAFFGVNANLGTDLWLNCLTAQICMHLDYLSRELEAYEPSEENSKEDCKFLMELIRKHQLMMDLHYELNGIFGISLIFNLISTTTLLCVTAMQLTIEDLGYEFVKFFAFFVLTAAQFFSICQRGQLLITMSEEVAVAAYKNGWYKASQVYKKLLFMLMLRAQKCAMLSAKGFTPISLVTFKIVLSMTYRFFALLQTMLK